MCEQLRMGATASSPLHLVLANRTLQRPRDNLNLINMISIVPWELWPDSSAGRPSKCQNNDT